MTCCHLMKLCNQLTWSVMPAPALFHYFVSSTSLNYNPDSLVKRYLKAISLSLQVHWACSSSVLFLSFLSALSPGGPWDPSAWKTPPGPHLLCVIVCVSSPRQMQWDAIHFSKDTVKNVTTKRKSIQVYYSDTILRLRIETAVDYDREPLEQFKILY